MALVTLLSSACFTAAPLALGMGIDRLVSAIQEYDSSVSVLQTATQALGLPLLLMGIAFLISSALAYLQQYTIAGVGEELTLSFRKDVRAKLSRLPLSYFDRHKTGDIMSQVTNDLEKVSTVMQVGLMQLISAVFTILFAVIAMLLLSPKLFVVVLISLILSIAATAYVSGLAQRTYGKNMTAMGTLSGKVEEIYTGNRDIKLFNQQQNVLDKVEALNEQQFKAQRQAQFADYAIYPAIRMLGQLGFIATAVFGGGKTTLVNLLMRFYELNGGTISIDGQNIITMPRGEMRRRIGMVLQDTWLFEGTVAENIAYGRMNATRKEIVAAAKSACCDHFIRTLPQGYDTVLSGEPPPAFPKVRCSCSPLLVPCSPILPF